MNEKLVRSLIQKALDKNIDDMKNFGVDVHKLAFDAWSTLDLSRRDFDRCWEIADEMTEELQ